MDWGTFEVMQIGYDVDHEELFRATGSQRLSLAWQKSKRIVAGSVGLFVIVAIVSIIVLIAVCKRRFEMFSSVSLTLLCATSLTVSALQIANLLELQENTSSGSYGDSNFIGGVLVVLILA